MKTKSESLFEEFLAGNKLPFEKIKEDITPRPDYRVSAGGSEIVFELKELAEDKNFDVVKDPACPYIKSSSRTVGDHVRRRIESSKNQIQFGARQGIPSVLLIYNNIDSVFQDFGTEPRDFIAAIVRRIYDPPEQRNQGRIGLVQRRGQDAPGEQEHLVQRRRPLT
jgi:hypothetical protein